MRAECIRLGVEILTSGDECAAAEVVVRTDAPAREADRTRLVRLGWAYSDKTGQWTYK